MFVNSPLLTYLSLRVLFSYLTNQIVDDTLLFYIHIHKALFHVRERNPRDPIVVYTYTTFTEVLLLLSSSHFLPSVSPSARTNSFGFSIKKI